MPLRAEAAAVVELVNVFQSVSVYMRARIIRTSVREIPQRTPLVALGAPRMQLLGARSGMRRELSVNFRRLFCNAHKLEVKLSS
jgi:hypothetical protein